MNRGAINLVVAFILSLVLAAAMALASAKICGLFGFRFFDFQVYMGVMTLGLTYLIRQVL